MLFIAEIDFFKKLFDLLRLNLKWLLTISLLSLLGLRLQEKSFVLRLDPLLHSPVLMKRLCVVVEGQEQSWHFVTKIVVVVFLHKVLHSILPMVTALLLFHL